MDGADTDDRRGGGGCGVNYLTTDFTNDTDREIQPRQWPQEAQNAQNKNQLGLLETYERFVAIQNTSVPIRGIRVIRG
jgi:hypothetical protein